MLFGQLRRADIEVNTAIAALNTLAAIQLQRAQGAVINFFQEQRHILTVELAIETLAIFDGCGDQRAVIVSLRQLFIIALGQQWL